ncbi:hypothetical protein RB594_001628 [Gaeumannomyces avenae]
MACLPQIEPAVRSQVMFLKQDALWETEKPYRLHYVPVDKNIVLSNFKTEEKEVNVYDARPLLRQLSLDTNGFEVHRLQSQPTYGDFSDYDKRSTRIRSTMRFANATKPFPYPRAATYAHTQPALLTHVDVTQRSVESIVREVYPGAAENILKGRIQCIRGPVEDWPLAVCDAALNQRAGHVFSPGIVGFLCRLSLNPTNCTSDNNPSQRWFYLSRQEDSEVLLFNAVDSDPARAAPVAHGAIPLPLTSANPIPRESIDARILVIHADIEYPCQKRRPPLSGW